MHVYVYVYLGSIECCHVGMVRRDQVVTWDELILYHEPPKYYGNLTFTTLKTLFPRVIKLGIVLATTLPFPSAPATAASRSGGALDGATLGTYRARVFGAGGCRGGACFRARKGLLF